VFVAPGDTIEGVDLEDGFLRGHGTQVVNGRLLATVCGTVERVNKLVSVRPLRTRYVPETGDVVLGRVTEIAGKRWKLDIGSRQDAILQLGAAHLPGGVQRRRDEHDELNMRDLYAETDLVSAEVQSFYADGAVALHTRSLKYGRLDRGQLVRVPPTLVKRIKRHFAAVDVPAGGAAGAGKTIPVALLLGCNGFVWVGAPSVGAAGEDAGTDAASPPEAASVGGSGAAVGPVDATTREAMCRAANATRALAALFLAIHPTAVEDVARASAEWGVAPKDMLGAGFLRRTLERETERRVARGGAW